MSLTTAQQTIFRAAVKVDVDPNVIAAYAAKDIDTLTSLYNTASNPVVSLWRPSISTSELNNAIVWSEYSGLVVAAQNTYLALVSVSSVDATQANIRSAFSTIFSGKVSLTNLVALAQTTATKFQALTGFLTVASPANVSSVYGYLLNRVDVGLALYDSSGNPL